MEYLKITDTLPDVSRVCLGTWAIGGWMWGGADDSESVATIHKALDVGINFIDTAPVYGFGRAESVVGRALKDRRDKAVIATKAGLEWQEDGKIFRNSTPGRIQREVEDSLQRLQTDYIDLYQIHWPDDLVAFEDTADMMAKLMQEGKIRAVGVSNYSVSQMKRFQKNCPIHTSQPPYNLFERAIDQDVFPYTEKHGIVTLAYGAICRGLLSGRMQPDTKFSQDDLRSFDPKFQPPQFGQYVRAAQVLDKFASERHQKSVLSLAIRWILDRGRTVALWGARRPDQLDAVHEAFGWQLTADDQTQMERMIQTAVQDPVGLDFMGAPHRNDPAYKGEDPISE